MDAFIGKWHMESSENFEEYMKAVGVSVVTRKIAANLKPNYVISAEPDNFFNLRTESTFKNSDMKFRLGEEFDETTSDGRKCKSVVRLEGNTLIQDQKGEKVPSVITRELTDKDTLVCICKAGEVSSKRVYKRAKAQE
jgi:hypothetical protein